MMVTYRTMLGDTETRTMGFALGYIEMVWDIAGIQTPLFDDHGDEIKYHFNFMGQVVFD